jgi:hypothetical protein
MRYLPHSQRHIETPPLRPALQQSVHRASQLLLRLKQHEVIADGRQARPCCPAGLQQSARCGASVSAESHGEQGIELCGGWAEMAWDV